MRCKNCYEMIAFSPYTEGSNTFCSKACAEGYKAAMSGFCSACLAETTEESAGHMKLINFIGTGWGWPWGRDSATLWISNIKKVEIFFLSVIITVGKFRVLFLNTSLTFSGITDEFLFVEDEDKKHSNGVRRKRKWLFLTSVAVAISIAMVFAF